MSFFTVANAVNPDFTGKARSGSQCFIAYDPNELIIQGVVLYFSDADWDVVVTPSHVDADIMEKCVLGDSTSMIHWHWEHSWDSPWTQVMADRLRRVQAASQAEGRTNYAVGAVLRRSSVAALARCAMLISHLLK